MKFVIEYDPLESKLSIVENEFTTFEILGLLEAAKVMISKDWMDKTE